MKKHLLIGLTAVFYTPLAFAQVTLTSAQVPATGTSWVKADWILPQSFAFQKTGTGLNWDFTGLTAGNNDTTFFLDPTLTAGNGQFAGATHASIEEGSTDVVYAVATANELKFLGIYGDPAKLGSPMAIKLNPQLVPFKFPYTYGSTNNTSGAFTAGLKGSEIGEPGFDSVRFKTTIIQERKVIGTGTLKTTMGTYNDAILERVIETQKDSAWAKIAIVGWQPLSASSSTDSSFNFYNGQSIVETAYVKYKDGMIDGIGSLLKSYNGTGTVGINEPAITAISSVFPVPFTTTTCFVFNSTAKSVNGYALNVYDVTGKLVDDIRGITGEKYIYHNTSLSKGVYTYRLMDNTTETGKGKLIVE